MCSRGGQPAACGPHAAQDATNAAQHKIVHLFKTYVLLISLISVCVFNVWPQTALLLPVWPRDARGLDAPGCSGTRSKGCCRHTS